MTGPKLTQEPTARVASETAVDNPMRHSSPPAADRQAVRFERQRAPLRTGAGELTDIIGMISIDDDLNRVSSTGSNVKRFHVDPNSPIRNIPTLEAPQFAAAFRQQFKMGLFEHLVQYNSKGVSEFAEQLKKQTGDTLSYGNVTPGMKMFLEKRRDLLSWMVSPAGAQRLEALELALDRLELKSFGDKSKEKSDAEAAYREFLRVPEKQRALLVEAFDALAEKTGLGFKSLKEATAKYELKGLEPTPMEPWFNGPAGEKHKLKDDKEAEAVAKQLQKCFGDGRAWFGAGKWLGWMVNDKESEFFKLLDQGYSDQDKAKIKEQFKKVTGVELDKQIQSSFNFEEAQYAMALLGNDQGRADAMGLHWAAKGMGTDNGAVERILRHMSYEDFKVVAAKFEAIYKGENLGKWLVGNGSLYSGDVSIKNLEKWTEHWKWEAGSDGKALSWKAIAAASATPLPRP